MANSKTSPTAGETKAKAEDNVPSGDVQPVIAVNGVEPDTKVDEVEGTDAAETPTMAELGGIRYIGMADTKTLTKQDLESLGAEEPKGDLSWDASNGKVVPTKEFNASTRDVLLAIPDFVVA